MRSLFKRKKKNEEPKTTIFGEPIIITPKKENKNSFKNYLKGGVTGFKNRAPKRRIRIRHFTKMKRVLAGSLCLIYLLTFIATLPNAVSLLFLATFFITLDYIWNTRIIKWTKE